VNVIEIRKTPPSCDANPKTSIGIIFCKSKDRLVVEYTFKDATPPTGVSSYSVTQMFRVGCKAKCRARIRSRPSTVPTSSPLVEIIATSRVLSPLALSQCGVVPIYGESSHQAGSG
jgi:hypothetical protein